MEDLNTIKNTEEISSQLTRLGYAIESEVAQNLASLALLIIKNTNASIYESIERAVGFEKKTHQYQQAYIDINNKLKKYKWWYFPRFPDTILKVINKNTNQLSTKKTNDIICEYYRQNNCSKMKVMAREWMKSKYFNVQKNNILELVQIYEIKCFNSAITISMVIMEGVIRNFINDKIGASYRFKTVKNTFINLISNSKEFYSDEIDIVYEIIEKLDDIFSGGFSPTVTDTVSDLVRDKRMHGFSYKKQNEATALKIWHLIDEIHYIINVLEDEN